ncbi:MULTISPECIES: L-rhamnose catabolism isomerase [unclassified Mesorhizobium]|uniref:L-rhamnose catabolism isomerase n=1 Tax=unclassified Mesorhizobium TaxID=325217 RepID=UPI000BAF1E6C|nr:MULTISPECIES: L-rhamnose catabolism isomerase [unclassified Mesorhizobium]PBB23239.1 L-rhamnose catabolism isomerase [Mesorhizobium sp. WSM4304]PBB71809.1 L-rhamnose catabolism isomerase [Mesorhizobium sp. WSM4308]
MSETIISAEIVEKDNTALKPDLERDYASLGERLDRRGIVIDAIRDKVEKFAVAIPSWGVGTGGTRFARFPGAGEPRDIFDKIEDCAVISQLTQATPTVSLHIPWDKADPNRLKQAASRFGLGFDAMNSNTFSDARDQKLSYKFGSLSHADAGTRRQAVEHNLECIEIGKTLGSKALTVWIGDGSNFPGQVNFAKAFERYLDAMKEIYAGLPADWKLFTEHKMYEPAFYSTVVQDWGTNYLIAKELGDKAFCLVDLGHHAPNVNIEMIVSRLIQFKKLGGFHFNDSKYGDDDLDAGSIDPYRLFLVFNELVDAELSGAGGFDPAHMLDQSHNVTDPIESLMLSAVEVQRAYAQALLVDRKALEGFQDGNDALMATQTLKAAYRTDVEPILAMARLKTGGAIDPVATYRAAGYRAKVAAERPAVVGGSGGIV